MSHHDEPIKTYEPAGNIWLRGLFMVIFAVFFGLAETVLFILALVQFLWMLFAKERNEGIADFGASVGKWLGHVAEFQTGATDEKPFPWGKWE